MRCTPDGRKQASKVPSSSATFALDFRALLIKTKHNLSMFLFCFVFFVHLRQALGREQQSKVWWLPVGSNDCGVAEGLENPRFKYPSRQHMNLYWVLPGTNHLHSTPHPSNNSMIEPSVSNGDHKKVSQYVSFLSRVNFLISSWFYSTGEKLQCWISPRVKNNLSASITLKRSSHSAWPKKWPRSA